MEILFDADAQDHAVAATAAAGADLAAVRREAGRQVARLLDGGRSGAAAETFTEAWSDWEAGAAQVSGALDGIGAGLARVGRELTASDAGSGTDFRRLGERLPS